MWILLHSMSSTRYLKHITLDGVQHLPEKLFQCIPYLESITIHHSESPLHRALFDRLVRLNSLDLAENQIPTVDRAWFQDLGGLKQLNLSGNSLSQVSHADFEKLHSLEALDLSGNRLAQIDASVFDSFRSAIEELYLTGNDLGALTTDAFQEMWSLRVSGTCLVNVTRF